MRLDQAYQLLAKVGLDADLRLEAPSGGLVQIRTRPDTGHLLIRCSEEEALRDLWELTRAIGTPKLRLRNLRHLRSPLLQDVHVTIGERELMEWPAGRFPRIRSLRLLLRLIG